MTKPKKRTPTFSSHDRALIWTALLARVTNVCAEGASVSTCLVEYHTWIKAAMEVEKLDGLDPNSKEMKNLREKMIKVLSNRQ